MSIINVINSHGSTSTSTTIPLEVQDRPNRILFVGKTYSLTPIWRLNEIDYPLSLVTYGSRYSDPTTWYIYLFALENPPVGIGSIVNAGYGTAICAYNVDTSVTGQYFRDLDVAYPSSYPHYPVTSTTEDGDMVLRFGTSWEGSWDRVDPYPHNDTDGTLILDPPFRNKLRTYNAYKSASSTSTTTNLLIQHSTSQDPTVQIALKPLSPPSPEEYDQYTKALLHFDEIDGSRYFNDELQNEWTPYYYPSTSGSGTIIKTDQYKFGTASGYFSGSTPGNWIQTDTDFAFGTQDFTIDCWIRPDLSMIASDWNRGLFGYDNITDNNNYWGFKLAGSAIDIQCFGYQHYIGGSAISSASGNIMPLEDNVWQHIAMVRQSTTIKGYLKGVLKATFTCASSIDMPIGKYFIVGNIGNSGWMRGYLDEFRISVGIARWTSNFTPPSSAYAPEGGTTTFYRQPFMYSSYGWI